jgi:outer membrane protein TolC
MRPEMKIGETVVLRVAMSDARFKTILRRPLDTSVRIENTLTEPAPVPPLEHCMAVALENRPKISSPLLSLEEMRSLVTTVQSEYFPNVNLLCSYSRCDDTPGVAGSVYTDLEIWSYSPEGDVR